MKKGLLEVITGCMASGKSEELIRRLRRAKIARQTIMVFKPQIDTRTDEETIASRSGGTHSAIAVDDPNEIIALSDKAQVIGIDEIHFFDDRLIAVIRHLTDTELKRVIVCGLDTDFRGEPFGVVAKLMAIADKVDKARAVCVKCFDPATRSQRLIDGKPAPADAPRILVGGDECYEARCRDCHQVPPAENKKD